VGFVYLGISSTGTEANVDLMALDTVSFTDFVGGIKFALQDVDKTFDNITLNNCGASDPNGCNGSNWVVNGGQDSNGALQVDTNTHLDNIDGIAFTSDGTGHAILLTTSGAQGSYDFNNFTFSGYGADATLNAAVYNDSGGAVTINVLGGDTPTVRNGTGASTIINNSVTVTVDGVAEGTAIKVVADETAGTVTAGDTLSQGLADNTGTYSFSLNYEGAFGAGLDVLITARNQGLPTAAIADDGGVLTDETTEANSGTTNDMTLTPATPAVNDAYYWGHPEEPTGLKINISNASSDTGQTITWEYWNGATWSSLTGVTDGTNSFQNAGLNKVTWTQPGDWATTTVNSQGPYYYLRGRVSAVGGTPNQAQGRWSSLDVTRYLPIPPQGELQRTITSSGLTATLTQQVDSISTF
jgi:hypothetical protein